LAKHPHHTDLALRGTLDCDRRLLTTVIFWTAVVDVAVRRPR